AVQDELHIAGAFEFFVDHVIHTAACIDECGGDDGKAAALLDLTGGTEEPFGWEKCAWIKTTGQSTPAGLHGQIVGATQACNTIQQNDHISACLDQAFCTLQHHLCHTRVCLGRFIESRTDHL